jgi:hypothetical protein
MRLFGLMELLMVVNLYLGMGGLQVLTIQIFHFFKQIILGRMVFSMVENSEQDILELTHFGLMVNSTEVSLKEEFGKVEFSKMGISMEAEHIHQLVDMI